MKDMRDISRRIAAGAMAAALFCGMAASVAAQEEAVTAPQTEIVVTDSSKTIIPPKVNNTTDEESDVDLQTALTKVKQRIDIPDSYDDFTYRRSENRGAVSYSFTWSMLETDTENSINVSITGDYITSYNKYGANDYESKPSFGKLSEEELTRKAEALTLQLNPALKGKYKLEFSGASLWGHNASFYGSRVENGVELSENSVSITLDKDTGELKSMNVNWWGNAAFASPSKKITTQEASEAFRKNITYTPRYHIVYDYETKKSSAVLLYYPDDFDSLDALTGKVTTMYEDMKKASDTGTYTKGALTADVAVAEEAAPAMNAGSAKAVTFTKAEKEAMLKNKELISQAEAEKIVKSDKYMKWTKDYILDSASLDRSDDRYEWRLNYIVRSDDDYRSVFACIDAKTGAVKSFSRYSNDDYKDGNIKFDKTKADVLAQEAYKYYMGERADEFRLDESDDDDGIMLIAKKLAGKRFRYTRYVNDLPCEDNSASISIGKDGTVNGFSYTYTDVKFPSAERITVDEAKDALLKAKKPTLEYSGFTDMKGNARTYLLYNLESSYINAKTGDLCNYDGEPITEEAEKEQDGYTDIKGNFAENYIRKLYEYGIRLECEDGKFNPSAAITEDDFRKLMADVTRSDEPIWLNERSREGTDKIKYADFVTREDAAVILVTATGGESVAKLKDIFRNEFKDVKDSDENLGFIAVACGMNVMAADGSGNFNPDVKITRARAMEMAYLYIQSINS